MLVFVGDQTSEDCKVWRTQWEPLFVASPVYKKLDYRVIYPPSARRCSPSSRRWPADLRWLLDTFLMSQVGVQEGFEVPRFFLVQNKQVTFSSLRQQRLAGSDVAHPPGCDERTTRMTGGFDG